MSKFGAELKACIDKQYECFITGSHAYGAPTEESDVDLVILADKKTKELLTALSDTKGIPVRFGNLNLIMPDTLEEFYDWKRTTNELKRRAEREVRPIGHDEAKAAFGLSLRKHYDGQPQNMHAYLG